MFGFGLNKLHARWLGQVREKSFGFFLLGIFLFANFPIPIPSLSLGIHPYSSATGGQGTESSEGEDQVPFPCQHGRCGCATARKCWTDCCCHTPSERLQWAKKRGVTPPTYAVLNESKKSAKRTSCCSTKVTDSVAKSKSKKIDSCCDKSTSMKASKPKERMVLSILACKCRGASSVFTALSWFINPDRCILQMPYEHVSESLVIFVSCWETIEHRPPSPPPKVG